MGMTFESGCDFFRETGCLLPLDVWPPEDRPPFERAFRAAAHAAWLRVGALFLQKRDADAQNRVTPWAQVEFGEPPCGKEANRERAPASHYERSGRGVHRSRLSPAAAALGLMPWQPSPLPLEIEGLGVDQDEPPAYIARAPHWLADYRLAQELQRELEKAAKAN